jgi:hypothetical protein
MDLEQLLLTIKNNLSQVGTFRINRTDITTITHG